MSSLLNYKRLLDHRNDRLIEVIIAQDRLFVWDDQLRVVEPFNAQLSIVNNEELIEITDSEHELKDEVVRLQGPCRVGMQLQCSRCLTDYTAHLQFEFDEMFTQHAQVIEEDPETDINLVESETIDLLPIIEDLIILEIPFVPLCKHECRGLCPQCGVDLNEESCDCVIRNIDPRLEKLQDFFKED